MVISLCQCTLSILEIVFFVLQSSSPCLNEAYKNRIVEESKIYKRPDEQLKALEKCVNDAARDLCLNDVSLLNKRNTLLELARKKVAENGYSFKKGHSRSKVYGQLNTSTPRRPKYDEKMREERMQNIEEELADISRIIHFKEKRLSQHEVAKNYRLCEQVTEEMISIKQKKRELEAERDLFVKKARRAKGRRRSAMLISDTSDNAPSSRSPTPQLDSSSRRSSLSSPCNVPSPLLHQGSSTVSYSGPLSPINPPSPQFPRALASPTSDLSLSSVSHSGRLSPSGQINPPSSTPTPDLGSSSVSRSGPFSPSVSGSGVDCESDSGAESSRSHF